MNPFANEAVVEQIRTFFDTHFRIENELSRISEDLRAKLESLMSNDQIIANNNVVAILDQSNFTYRYISPSIKTIYGVESKVFMEGGMGVGLSMIYPEDNVELLAMFERATRLVMTLPVESRIHFHLNYSMRLQTPVGKIRVYQQTIPLALNENGYPYLFLALQSDVTEFNLNQGITYKAILNEPGKPAQVMLTGEPKNNENPLTDREKEIVFHLADGLDANAIGEKLFISEGTVRTHRKNILEKTGAKNSVHLIRMAVANGWV